MFYLITTPILFVFGSSLIAYFLRTKNANLSPRYSVGTHVIISGGSKGIGKSLAKKYAELGTHVTIIARNEATLLNAKSEIEKHRRNSHIQKIRIVPLDLTKLTFPDNSNSDLTIAQKNVLETILGEHERCDIVINCCGSALAARFDDTSQKEFQYLMDVNYFSAVNLTRLLLPVMKAKALANQNTSRANNGHIVFVSSMAGLVSFFGYSAYSASKFALVGLAEALHMELSPFDIGVTVSFPPDTDTPGFEEENKTKPSLTAKLSETGSIMSPDDVAKSIIDDIRLKKFYSTVGIENLLVLSSLNSFMPTTTILRAIGESFLAMPLKLVAFFIIRSWYKLVGEASTNEIIRAEIAMKCSRNGKYEDKKLNVNQAKL